MYNILMIENINNKSIFILNLLSSEIPEVKIFKITSNIDEISKVLKNHLVDFVIVDENIDNFKNILACIRLYSYENYLIIINNEISSCINKIKNFIFPSLNTNDTLKQLINIELKSAKVSDGRILKQLNQNKYYLHLIHKPLYQYTYVMSENTFYKIDNDSLVMAKPEEVRKLLLNHKKAIPIDLGDIFKPENIFASPFYMTSRFIQNDYLLTDSEQLVERQIIKFLENDEDVIKLLNLKEDDNKNNISDLKRIRRSNGLR